jgi:hypothetical protein
MLLQQSAHSTDSTSRAVKCLNGWILPGQGDHGLDHVKPAAVEEWLDSVKEGTGHESEESECDERNLSSRNKV